MLKIIDKDTRSILSKVDLSPLKNKKVLITGASGLLGIYFVNCIKKIYKEYNIDAYFINKNKVEEPLDYFFDFNCNIIEEDLTEYDFKELPNFDVIIHAAGYGQPGKFMHNKIKTIEINSTCTLELLKKLKKDGKFLFISTSEMYSGLRDNVNETMMGSTNTNHPRACYIESKKCGETLCNVYREYGYDVKSARLSLAYGPGTRVNDARVLNNFIEKSIKNGRIELMDSGSGIRTYCYITDVIEMMWNILLYGKSDVYNVGGESVVTIYELAKIVADNVGVEVILPEVDNSLAGSPAVVNMDISKYITEFERPNFVNINDGIGNTIEWQKFIYSL